MDLSFCYNECTKAQQESKCPLTNIIRAFVVIYEAGNGAKHKPLKVLGLTLCLLAGRDGNRLN